MLPILGHQGGVIRQLNGAAFAQNTGNGLLRRLTGLLVDDAKHALDRLARCLLGLPTGERFGHGIDKADSPFGIRGDHGVADARERDAQPLPLLAELPVGLVAV